MDSVKRYSFPLRASRFQRLLQVLVALSCILTLSLFPAPAWARLTLILLCLLLLFFNHRRYTRQWKSIRSLEYLGGDRWMLLQQQGRGDILRLRRDSYVNRHLLVLRFEGHETPTRVAPLVLWRDSLAKPAYRNLYLLVNAVISHPQST